MSPTRIAELNAGPADEQGPHRSRGRGREQMSQLELSDEQQQRTAMRAGEPVTVITGGPGTGKTTLLRSLLARSPTSDEADTGRADRTRRSPAPGGHGPRRENYSSPARIRSRERRVYPRKNFQLRTNYLIIDEASMMDVELASSLVSRADAGLLSVAGRRSRSASVGRSGQRAQGRDCIRLRAGSQLNEVYRQARESLIVANAHRLNRGEFPKLSNRRRRRLLFLRAQRRPTMWSQTIKQLVQQRLVDASESATLAKSRC